MPLKFVVLVLKILLWYCIVKKIAILYHIVKILEVQVPHEHFCPFPKMFSSEVSLYLFLKRNLIQLNLLWYFFQERYVEEQCKTWIFEYFEYRKWNIWWKMNLGKVYEMIFHINKFQELFEEKLMWRRRRSETSIYIRFVLIITDSVAADKLKPSNP